jgi:hypothetical protein
MGKSSKNINRNKKGIPPKVNVTDPVWDYDAGGALLGAGQGAMSGAAAGAAIVPPWGAIVGGAIGGVMGAAKSIAGDKAQARQDEADRVGRVQQNRLTQYNNMIGDRDTQIPTFAFGGVLSEYYTPASRPVHNMYALGGDINKINEKFDLGWQGWMANGGPTLSAEQELQLLESKFQYPGSAYDFVKENPEVMTKKDRFANARIYDYPSMNNNPEPITGTAPAPGVKQTFSLLKGAAGVADKVRRVAANSKAIQGAEVIDDISKMPNTIKGYLSDPKLEQAFKNKYWDKINTAERAKYKSFWDKLPWKEIAMGGYVENPAWYQSNALSLAAGGHLPEGNATLKEAKEFEKMYPEEFKYGTETEYEHTGNKKLAMRIAADHIKDSIKMNQGAPPDYYKKLQMAGISDELNKLPLMTMAKGGFLSASKASEMLKDGKIHGKALTDRQKAYFQAIAHGWKPGQDKANGGPVYPKGGAAIWDAMGGPMYAGGGYTNTAVQDTVIANNKYRKPLIPNTQAYADSVVAAEPIGSMKARRALYDVGKTYGTPTGPSDTRFSAAPQVSAYQGVQETFNNLVNRSVPMEQFKVAPAINLARPTPMQQMDNESFNTYMQQYYPVNRAFGGSVPGFAGTGRILDVGNTSGNNQNNNTNFEKNIVTKYEGGGTHEENRYGGIQVGPKARVEEGEYRFDDPDSGESYIFSNRF